MRRLVIGIGGFVLAGAVLGGLLIGTGAAQTNDTGTNASFGADISSFMQASDAETQAEVDDEMFEVRLNRTTDPQERRGIIEQRQQRLTERDENLRTQRATLTGSGSDVRGRALATRVVVGSTGLERSVNATERAAMAIGMDTEQLDVIRSSARGLRGPDVADLARGLSGSSGVPVSGPPDGPPEPPDNGGAPDEPGSNDAREADQPEATSDRGDGERSGSTENGPNDADDGPSDASLGSETQDESAGN